jgi:hypothetical protein
MIRFIFSNITKIDGLKKRIYKLQVLKMPFPNVVKYSTSNIANSLRKGNVAFGTKNTQGTGYAGNTFYNGINPPEGGYTIYMLSNSGQPVIYTAADSTALIYFANYASPKKNITTVEAALGFFATSSDIMCFNRNFGDIITDSLGVCVDVTFTPSWPTTGSTLYDISGNSTNIILAGSPSYSTSFQTIDLDGSSQYCYIDSPSIFYNNVTTFSWEMWVKIDSFTATENYLVSYNISGNNDFAISVSSSAIGAYVNGTDYRISRTVSNDFAAGVLTQLVFTFDLVNDVYYYYVNGVLKATKTGVTQNISSSLSNIITLFAKNTSGSYSNYWDGSFSDIKFYSKVLSLSEILFNYRTDNVFPNGDFRWGSNINFAINGTLNSDVTLPGKPYSLQIAQQFLGSIESQQFIEVNTSNTYQYTAYNRTLSKGGVNNNILSGGHLGFTCYDSSFRFIDLRNCGGVANTVLTRDLVAGDTYAYVSNANQGQWSAVNATYFFRHFCLYPPTHPEFNQKWTYTRIGSGDYNIYYDEITDVGNGELRFRFANAAGAAATFPNIGYPTPAGTGVMNGVAGGTYNYVFYPAEGPFESWAKWQSSLFTGENRNSSTPFRFATKYVRFLHLINYSVPSGTTPLPIMLFGDVKLEQIY